MGLWTYGGMEVWRYEITMEDKRCMSSYHAESNMTCCSVDIPSQLFWQLPELLDTNPQCPFSVSSQYP